MFWSKNQKNRYTTANPSFFYIKVGFKGLYISRRCFPDGLITTEPTWYRQIRNNRIYKVKVEEHFRAFKILQCDFGASSYWICFIHVLSCLSVHRFLIARIYMCFKLFVKRTAYFFNFGFNFVKRYTDFG